MEKIVSKLRWAAVALAIAGSASAAQGKEAACDVQKSAEDAGRAYFYTVKVVEVREGRRTVLMTSSAMGPGGLPIKISSTNLSSYLPSIERADGKSEPEGYPGQVKRFDMTLVPAAWSEAVGIVLTKVEAESASRQVAELDEAERPETLEYKAASCLGIPAEGGPAKVVLDRVGDPEEKGGSAVEAFISVRRVEK